MRYLPDSLLALGILILLAAALPHRTAAQEQESIPVTFTQYTLVDRGDFWLNCYSRMVGSHADPVGNGDDSDYTYTGSGIYYGEPPEWTGVHEDIPGVRITYLAGKRSSSAPDPDGEKNCDDTFEGHAAAWEGASAMAHYTPPPNEPPTACFDYEEADELFTITFDASCSEDEDGEVVDYDWDFGDGESGSGESPEHTYEERGEYEATLIVTDDDGDESEPEREEVEVKGPDLRYVVSVEPVREEDEEAGKRTGGEEDEDDEIQVSDTVRVKIAVENIGDWDLENVHLPGDEQALEITNEDEDPDAPEVVLEFIEAEQDALDALAIGEADTLKYLYEAIHATEEVSLLVTEVAVEAIHPDTNNEFAYSESESTCTIASKGEPQDEENEACLRFPINPAPFIVNSTGNAPLDDGIDPDEDGCSTGNSITRDGESEPECTLRAAVQGAARSKRDHVEIEFDIPDGGGLYRIALSGEALPVVSVPVTLTGPSKDGTPVEIDGSGLGGEIGFDLGGDSTTVAALAFYGFPATVLALRGRESVLTGSFVGSDWARSYADPDASDALRNGGVAVLVTGDRTRIGGPGSEGNLIIGSTIGVLVEDAHDVDILGNDIGILEMPHAEHGIDLHEADRATIGTPEAPNYLGYNLEYGLRIDAATTGAQVRNNTIIRSRMDGILVQQGSSGAFPTRIGGEEEGAGNTIERSIGAGIRVVGSSTDATPTDEASISIQGNTLKSNEEIGIRVEGGSAVQIGGATGAPGTGAGNTIEDGIELDPGYASWVQGNLIARLDPETGYSDEGAVVRVGGIRNIIGGKKEDEEADGNVIYGIPEPREPTQDNPATEEGVGFGIWDDGTTTTIRFNMVGTEGPLYTGVVLNGTDSQVIENTISGNTAVGLSVRTDATIEGNYIGVTTTGNGALPNGGPGIEVFTQATIGGYKEGYACERPCNVISGNEGPGIFIRKEATGTTVQGNMIGVGVDGLTLVGNSKSGIVVLADNVRIGGENDIELGDCYGPCNLIAAKGGDGIRNFEAKTFPNLHSGGPSETEGADTGGASGLVIEGNFIGTGLPIPGSGNAGHGIALGALGSNNRVGNTGRRGNLIAGNDRAGVLVLASSESGLLGGTWRGGTGNRIRGNRIVDNGGLAIDLYPNYILPGGDGWSALDVGDADEGPNTMINWPYLIESDEVEGISGQRSLLVLWTGTDAGTYTLDVYTNETCRGPVGEAGNFLVSREMAFPVGGAANIEAARVDVPFVPSMPYYTATFTDSEGNTSELSNCRRAGDRPDQALQSVEPGIRTGINHLLIQLSEGGEGSPKQAAAQALLVLRSDDTPGGDRFEATAALTPEGNVVMPQSTRGTYWEVIAPAAPAPIQYDVCLDVADVNATDELLVLGRDAATDGRWRPYDTRLETVDGTSYACADGLSAMHLTLGSGSEAVLAAPTLLTPEDGATAIDLTASLSWQPVDGAASYDLQLGLNAGLTVLLADAQGIAGTSYAPSTLARTQRHYWRVRGVTTSGEAGPWSVPFHFQSDATSVDVEEEAGVPETFVLEANYPNPFNPQTTIGFSLPQAAEVRLVVYDVLGRAVRVLAEGMRPAGRHEAVLDAARLPSGMYLYRLEAEGFVQTRRMLLVK